MNTSAANTSRGLPFGAGPGSVAVPPRFHPYQRAEVALPEELVLEAGVEGPRGIGEGLGDEVRLVARGRLGREPGVRGLPAEQRDAAVGDGGSVAPVLPEEGDAVHELPAAGVGAE